MRNVVVSVFQVLHNAWIKIGITVLLLLSMEIIATILFHFRDKAAANNLVDIRSTADSYSGADWAADYYRELSAAPIPRWVPYVYWRPAPFHGEYININEEGLRVTWSPMRFASTSSHSLNILMLGGSVVWGWGSRDEFTLPSLLAKMLAARGLRAQVTNLGQIGYVSRQEVVALQLELAKGNIPDIVIFLDGCNDTFSAYQHGEAGLPGNEFNRVKEFNSSKKKVLPSWNLIVRDLSIVRFAKSVAYRLGFKPITASAVPSRSEMVDGPAAAQRGRLAHDVVSVYRANIEIVKALRSHFGFRMLFYWQPTLFEKIELTTYEQKQKLVYTAFQGFFEDAYRTMRESNLATTDVGIFHNLSSIFAHTDEPIFVDWCHLGETGNALIAERMLTDILPIAKARIAQRRQSQNHPITDKSKSIQRM